MRGQGLGPGFTRVATRRSVIFKPEGLELVFMVFEKTSVASPATMEPPSAIAEAFSISRRSNELPPFLFMARCPLHSDKFFGFDFSVWQPTGIISENIRPDKISRLTNRYSFESFGRSESLLRRQA